MINLENMSKKELSDKEINEIKSSVNTFKTDFLRILSLRGTNTNLDVDTYIQMFNTEYDNQDLKN